MRYMMVLSLLCLTGCASMLGEETQAVTVTTPGARNAWCFLETPEHRYKTYPPQTVRITKTQYDLTVNCKAPGGREKTVVVPRMTDTRSLLNFTNGLFPGMYYDHESGAVYGYPSEVAVDFSDIAASYETLPAYHSLDTVPPLGSQGIEPYNGRKNVLHGEFSQEEASVEVNMDTGTVVVVEGAGIVSAGLSAEPSAPEFSENYRLEEQEVGTYSGFYGDDVERAQSFEDGQPIVITPPDAF